MIAHIFGEVSEKFGNSSVIVDVNGVGYEISVSVIDFDNATLGEEAKFYTHHHIREQSEELYGFTSLAAKKIFELLISVQGVGPKAALSILGLSETENVRNAIANSDSAYIQKASGIGKKTAERIVVDLSDKIGLPTSYGRKDDVDSSEIIPANDEALEALIALGYTINDATKALSGVDKELSTSDRIKQALKSSN